MRKPIERRECATGLVWAQHAYVKLRICIDAYVRFVVNALWCVFSTLPQWKVAFMNYCWYKKIFNNFLVPGKKYVVFFIFSFKYHVFWIDSRLFIHRWNISNGFSYRILNFHNFHWSSLRIHSSSQGVRSRRWLQR